MTDDEQAFSAFLGTIESSSDDARFVIWNRVYESEQRDMVVAKVLAQGGDVVKVLFARFLALIERDEALVDLITLMHDSNAHVVSQAIKSFDKNQHYNKTHHLMKALDTNNRDVQLYAIEQLSGAGQTDLTQWLLDRLNHVDHDELIHYLHALRLLSDRRSLEYVGTLLHHANEDVRLGAVLVIGAIHESGFGVARRMLLKMLADKSARVRHAVIWTLRRRPFWGDVRRFYHFAVSDPSALVREESMFALARTPTAKLVRMMVARIVHEVDRTVALKIESMLLNFPESVVMRGLRQSMRHVDDAVYQRVVVLAAHFMHQSDSLLAHIMRHLANRPSDRVRLALIESLGYLQHVDAIALLESCLKSDALTAYVSMSALVRINECHQSQDIIKHLDANHSDIIKQIVLKHVARYHTHFLKHDWVCDKIAFLLQNTTINIRYLASEIMADSPRIADLVRLLELARTESYDMIRTSIIKNLVMSLRSPGVQAQMMASCTHRDQAAFLIELMSAHAIVLHERVWLAWFEHLDTLDQIGVGLVVQLLILLLKQSKHNPALVTLIDHMLSRQRAPQMIDGILNMEERSESPLISPVLFDHWYDLAAQFESARQVTLRKKLIEWLACSRDDRVTRKLACLAVHDPQSETAQVARHAIINRMAGAA